MTARYQSHLALLLLGTALSGCGGDSTAPSPTLLEFNIVTSGVDLDADGYLLTIDGASTQTIPANGTLNIPSNAGTHTLAIDGLAFNCDVTAAPASADVAQGKTTRVDIQASCTPYLRNAILYISQEFGLDDVMAMRPDGSRRVRLTNDGVNFYAPVVAPDGQSIAVAAGPVPGGSDGIFLLDRFGKGRIKVVGRSSGDTAPAFSPDGTKIAFLSLNSGPGGNYGRVFIVNRDGTGLRQLTPETSGFDFDIGVSWAPDGTRLVFSRNGVLMLINADGTGLVSTGVSGSDPAWSPDGTRIAYESVNGGNDGIWVMDMSFTPHRLTQPVQADQMPKWSANGIQIVFERVESNVAHLYRMNADGSGAIKLTSTAQGESWPTWSPNF